MSGADSTAMGARVAAARGRAGLTQAQLASEVSLERSVIAKIENGTRRISAVELVRIADVLGERIEWFVTDPPAAIVSHRDLNEPGAPGPVIDRFVERVTRGVEFAFAHDEQWGPGALPRLDRPLTASDAEVAASRARTLLGTDEAEPCFDLAGRAGALGLFVFSFDMGHGTADAASLLADRCGVAIVNGSLQVGRRRLAAAHELGHHLFADEYTVDWRMSERADDSLWEGIVDRFARAVLIPSTGLRIAWKSSSARGDDLRTAAVRLASAYRVDMSTLARRLLELGHVDAGAAGRIRQVRTTKADIVELDLVVHDEFAPPSLPRAYQTSILRMYRRETISAARATDLLFDTFHEDDLPELPPLPEGAIWEFVS